MLINTAIHVRFLMLVNIPAKDTDLIRLSKCTLYRRSVLQRLKEVRCIELKIIFRWARMHFMFRVRLFILPFGSRS